MNIQDLQQLLSRITEIKILGKTTVSDGVIYHIMGIVRYDNCLRLLILQFDENFDSYAEENEMDALNNLTNSRLSNRHYLHRSNASETCNKLQAVRQVKIGDMQFEIDGTESKRCNEQNWDILSLITEFLRYGWHPEDLNYQNIDNLLFISAELTGAFASIPEFGENPGLEIKFHDIHTGYLVEQQVQITVGTEYPDKLWFTDKNKGNKHWLLINRVYLCNIWEEILNSFNNPRLLEQLSPEEIEKAKTDFEKQLLEICPRDMYFPVIEYECEEEITPVFYSNVWLDGEPVNNNSSSGIGFLVKPDKKNGVLGFPLKTSFIHEPVPADTKSIEAELFLFNKLEKFNDIIM